MFQKPIIVLLTIFMIAMPIVSAAGFGIGVAPIETTEEATDVTFEDDYTGDEVTDAPAEPTDAPDEPENPTEPPVTVAKTEAPATQPPATAPPATEAPATEAPATQAPATEAPATQAPATEAPAPTPEPTEEPEPTPEPAPEPAPEPKPKEPATPEVTPSAVQNQAAQDKENAALEELKDVTETSFSNGIYLPIFGFLAYQLI